MGRRGFTILEVLVSVTLVAALVVAVTGVLALVSRRSASIARSDELKTWSDRLIDQLRDDIEHARTWEFAGRQLVLKGFSAQEETAGVFAEVSSAVTYRVSDLVAGRAWLIRTWQEENPIDNRPVEMDLMASDIREVKLFLPGATQPQRSASGTIPASFRLELYFAGSNAPLILHYCR